MEAYGTRSRSGEAQHVLCSGGKSAMDVEPGLAGHRGPLIECVRHRIGARGDSRQPSLTSRRDRAVGRRLARDDR